MQKTIGQMIVKLPSNIVRHLKKCQLNPKFSQYFAAIQKPHNWVKGQILPRPGQNAGNYSIEEPKFAFLIPEENTVMKGLMNEKQQVYGQDAGYVKHVSIDKEQQMFYQSLKAANKKLQSLEIKYQEAQQKVGNPVKVRQVKNENKVAVDVIARIKNLPNPTNKLKAFTQYIKQHAISFFLIHSDQGPIFVPSKQNREHMQNIYLYINKSNLFADIDQSCKFNDAFQIYSVQNQTSKDKQLTPLHMQEYFADYLCTIKRTGSKQSKNKSSQQLEEKLRKKQDEINETFYQLQQINLFTDLSVDGKVKYEEVVDIDLLEYEKPHKKQKTKDNEEKIVKIQVKRDLGHGGNDLIVKQILTNQPSVVKFFNQLSEYWEQLFTATTRHKNNQQADMLSILTYLIENFTKPEIYNEQTENWAYILLYIFTKYERCVDIPTEFGMYWGKILCRFKNFTPSDEQIKRIIHYWPQIVRLMVYQKLFAMTSGSAILFAQNDLKYIKIRQAIKTAQFKQEIGEALLAIFGFQSNKDILVFCTIEDMIGTLELHELLRRITAEGSQPIELDSFRIDLNNFIDVVQKTQSSQTKIQQLFRKIKYYKDFKIQLGVLKKGEFKLDGDQINEIQLLALRKQAREIQFDTGVTDNIYNDTESSAQRYVKYMKNQKTELEYQAWLLKRQIHEDCIQATKDNNFILAKWQTNIVNLALATMQDAGTPMVYVQVPPAHGKSAIIAHAAQRLILKDQKCFVISITTTQFLKNVMVNDYMNKDTTENGRLPSAEKRISVFTWKEFLMHDMANHLKQFPGFKAFLLIDEADFCILENMTQASTVGGKTQVKFYPMKLKEYDGILCWTGSTIAGCKEILNDMYVKQVTNIKVKPICQCAQNTVTYLHKLTKDQMSHMYKRATVICDLAAEKLPVTHVFIIDGLHMTNGKINHELKTCLVELANSLGTTLHTFTTFDNQNSYAINQGALNKLKQTCASSNKKLIIYTNKEGARGIDYLLGDEQTGFVFLCYNVGRISDIDQGLGRGARTAYTSANGAIVCSGLHKLYKSEAITNGQELTNLLESREYNNIHNYRLKAKMLEKYHDFVFDKQVAPKTISSMIRIMNDPEQEIIYMKGDQDRAASKNWETVSNCFNKDWPQTLKDLYPNQWYTMIENKDFWDNLHDKQKIDVILEDFTYQNNIIKDESVSSEEESDSDEKNRIEYQTFLKEQTEKNKNNWD